MKTPSGLPPNLGIQGRSGNLIFSQRKSGEIERYFRISGKVRELLSF